MKNWKQTHNLVITVNSKGEYFEMPVMRIVENNTIVLFSEVEWDAQDCAAYEIRKNVLTCNGQNVIGNWELIEV